MQELVWNITSLRPDLASSGNAAWKTHIFRSENQRCTNWMIRRQDGKNSFKISGIKLQLPDQRLKILGIWRFGQLPVFSQIVELKRKSM